MTIRVHINKSTQEQWYTDRLSCKQWVEHTNKHTLAHKGKIFKNNKALPNKTVTKHWSTGSKQFIWKNTKKQGRLQTNNYTQVQMCSIAETLRHRWSTIYILFKQRHRYTRGLTNFMLQAHMQQYKTWESQAQKCTYNAKKHSDTNKGAL